jgi:hypothetical protein
MTYDQGPACGTHSDQHEAIFILRFVGVVQQQTILVKKDGLRLLERDAMFPPVALRLPWIPDEPYVHHTLHCNDGGERLQEGLRGADDEKGQRAAFHRIRLHVPLRHSSLSLRESTT